MTDHYEAIRHTTTLHNTTMRYITEQCDHTYRRARYRPDMTPPITPNLTKRYATLPTLRYGIKPFASSQHRQVITHLDKASRSITTQHSADHTNRDSAARNQTPRNYAPQHRPITTEHVTTGPDGTQLVVTDPTARNWTSQVNAKRHATTGPNWPKRHATTLHNRTTPHDRTQQFDTPPDLTPPTRRHSTNSPQYGTIPTGQS